MGVIAVAGCSPPCEETLIDDPSEFDDFETAAAAEAFCGEPTLGLVLGEAAAQGDWTDADAVQDGDEAWFGELGPDAEQAAAEVEHVDGRGDALEDQLQPCVRRPGHLEATPLLRVGVSHKVIAEGHC